MKFNLKTSGFAVVIASFAVSSAFAVGIQNFGTVSPGIYRGADPGDKGLQELKAMGVETVINLRSESEENNHEEAVVRALGMDYVSVPMLGFWFPEDHEVNRALDVLADPTRRPVFVHCLHGQDRTGLVVGLHRVFHDGWKKAAAYAEMEKMGFHAEILPFTLYWKKRTRNVP